jgi:hypothetical protein
MAVEIPTTQELTDQNIARFEARLNQTIPANDQSFIRVLSVVEAMIGTSLNKMAAERYLQNLALTATGDDLDRIGIEYGVVRKPAIAAVLEIDQPANNGTTIQANTEYVGDSNGVRYIVNSTVVAAGGQADLEVTAKETGDVGNLTTGDTLTIVTQIPGITSTTATYDSTTTTGVDRESDDSYRRRILNEIRTVGGGSNPVDYRTWAEEAPEVFRAFPYSGAHTTSATKKLKDGDMEEDNTIYWSAGRNALITKNTTAPKEGVRDLRVGYNGINEPYAYQICFQVGKSYTISGWFRGSGISAAPSLRDSGGQIIFSGTSSPSWVYNSATFTATGSALWFYSTSTSGSDYVYFDDFELTCNDSWSGDRTVYIEAISSIDPDGIPTQAVLDSARSYINTDPDTGLSRPALGTTDETLFVEPIYRTTLYLKITNLVVDASLEAQVKADIEDAVDEYFRAATPFIDGIDFDGDRNDTITNLTLSSVVQDILNPVGGSASSITFGLTAGFLVALGKYQLGRGELTKLGTIAYA